MKRIACLLGLGILIAAGGCSPGFPYGMSHDRHTFLSTDTMPLTVVLRDTRVGEPVLRIDVPVRRKLVIDFEHQYAYTATQTSALPAESVSWQIMNPKDWEPMLGKLKHRKQLSGNNILMKVEIRDSPEMPSTAAAPPPPAAPAPPPVQPVAMQGEPDAGPAPEPMVEPGPTPEPAEPPAPTPAVADADAPPSAGVGIRFEKRPEQLRIIEVFDNSPAMQAGLAVGDAILEIDGASIEGMTLRQAVKHLTGPVGSPVRLTVQHPRGHKDVITVIRRPLNRLPDLDLDAPEPVDVEARPVE